MTCIHTYTEIVEIVWDPVKARQNLRKHGVRFADAVMVLDDPYAITLSDSESEPVAARWVTLGAEPHERTEYVAQI